MLAGGVRPTEGGNEMANGINSRDLDTYITGHWGEDQFRNEPGNDDDDTCWQCGGEGYVVNDCFEDTCCCADPETEHGVRTCDICEGTGEARRKGKAK